MATIDIEHDKIHARAQAICLKFERMGTCCSVPIEESAHELGPTVEHS